MRVPSQTRVMARLAGELLSVVLLASIILALIHLCQYLTAGFLTCMLISYVNVIMTGMINTGVVTLWGRDHDLEGTGPRFSQHGIPVYRSIAPARWGGHRRWVTRKWISWAVEWAPKHVESKGRRGGNPSDSKSASWCRYTTS